MSAPYVTITAKEWREIGGDTLAEAVLDTEKITVLQSQYLELKEAKEAASVQVQPVDLSAGPSAVDLEPVSIPSQDPPFEAV